MGLINPPTLEPLGELEMLSPWFDATSPTQAKQQAIQEARRLLVLLAPPRSGSFHLCRLLWQLGYGRPTEYLNPNPLYRSALGRWGRVGSRAWVAALVAERSARSRFSGIPFFSLKLQANQGRGPFERVVRRTFRAPLAAIGLREEPPLVVFLLRRDVRAAIASLHFSRCTGAFDLGLVTTHQGLPIQSLLDPAAIRQTIEEYRSHLAWLEQARQKRSPTLELWLEDLVADQAGALGRLVQTLEPGGAVDLGDPWLAVRIRRDPSPWQQERRAWLDRIAERVTELSGDQWSDFAQQPGAPVSPVG